ncbi:serine hydrolase, partial [Microbacterium sp. BF1]
MRGRDGAGAAITPETRFRIASMSKSMTATAIM